MSKTSESSRRFLGLYGLTETLRESGQSVWQALDGSGIELRAVDDPHLPAAIIPGSTGRKYVWGVADDVSLDRIREELSKDRLCEVRDGLLTSVDDDVSEAAALRNGLIPRARVVGMAAAGIAPRIMGVGPVDAALKLLARTNLQIDDIDVLELNEAFASQAIASLRDLGVDPLKDPRVNRNGGAIALGHPLGMTSARVVMTAVEELHRSDGKFGLVFMCVGVGQGLALMLERVWELSMDEMMSQSVQADVVVVGAGHGGAQAAKCASNIGLSEFEAVSTQRVAGGIGGGIVSEWRHIVVVKQWFSQDR